MPGPNVVQGDLIVTGTFSAQGNVPSSGSVGDIQVGALAAISPTKVQRIFSTVYAQPNTTATSSTQVVQVVRAVGGGTLLEFSVGCIVAPIGAATVTFDLRKNGSTILTAVATLNSSSTPYTLQFATPSTSTLAQSDVLSVVIVATAGGGTLPTGVFCNIRLSEAAI